MKKYLLLAMALSIGALVVCGDSSSSSINSAADNGKSVEVGDALKSVVAFFPSGYKVEDVVAWYATGLDSVKESGKTKYYVDAVYLFENGTFIATESKLKVTSDSVKFSQGLAAEGTWTGSKDDFKNGAFIIEAGDETFKLDIKDGVFTIGDMEDGRSMTMSFMKTTDVPTPTNAGQYNRGINDSSNKESENRESGDNTSTKSVSAFFPKGYNADDVVAWYATDVLTDTHNGVKYTYISAVYLFKDHTFIVTESQARSDDSKLHAAMVANGEWSSNSDDYSSATIEITLNSMKIPLEVNNGKFSINPDGEGDMYYTLMTSDVPKGTEAESGDVVEEGRRDGTEDQVKQAYSMIKGSEESSIVAFDISEPKWEERGVTYWVTYTITATLNSGEFVKDEKTGFKVAIGNYPVHAIGVQETTLPRNWNNCEWTIIDTSSSENSMTITISQKIDNLKIGRAFASVKVNGETSIEYSEAFFIAPPGSEVEFPEVGTSEESSQEDTPPVEESPVEVSPEKKISKDVLPEDKE